MARFVAGENSLSMRWESGLYGSASGGRLWIGGVQESTIDENTNTQAIRYLGTSTRNVDQFVETQVDVGGTFTYFPQDWRVVVAALGSNVDAGSPSPYTHVISELESNAASAQVSGTLNPFTSFTLEEAKQFNDTGENFLRTVVGCNVNNWALNGTQGEILSCDVDYIAQDVTFTSGAVTEATEDTTRPFIFSDCRLHLPSGTIISELKSFSLSVNNNLEAPHYVNGSRVIAPPVPLNRDYEFTATLDSTTNNTKLFWQTHFTGGSTTSNADGAKFNLMLEVNASTGSRDAFFIMSGCKLMDIELPSPQEGINETTLQIVPETMSVNINDAVFKYNY